VAHGDQAVHDRWGLCGPEEEARVYECEVLAGRAIVSVQAGERYADAIAILRRHGAYDASAPSLGATARLP
jgi:hypothetical protein